MVKNMSNLRYAILSALFATSLVFSTQIVAGANLGVSPIKIQLSPINKTGALTIFNKGDTPVNLQLDAKSWDMDENGKFIETDTGDFIFYPKTLTIKPKEQASVRVGYMSDFPNTEKPYRLFIYEIPNIKQTEPEKNKVNIGLNNALSISMPVYVVPMDDVPAPQVELSQIKADNQKLRIGVKNLTAYHVDLNKVTAKLLKGGSTLVEKSVDLKLQRVLGEHQVFIDLPIDAKKLCQQADAIAVQVEATNLTPPYQTQVPLKTGCIQ
jgi:P pilus assembly chaperone PapD